MLAPQIRPQPPHRSEHPSAMNADLAPGDPRLDPVKIGQRALHGAMDAEGRRLIEGESCDVRRLARRHTDAPTAADQAYGGTQFEGCAPSDPADAGADFRSERGKDDKSPGVIDCGNAASRSHPDHEAALTGQTEGAGAIRPASIPGRSSFSRLSAGTTSVRRCYHACPEQLSAVRTSQWRLSRVNQAAPPSTVMKRTIKATTPLMNICSGVILFPSLFSPFRGTMAAEAARRRRRHRSCPEPALSMSPSWRRRFPR